MGGQRGIEMSVRVPSLSVNHPVVLSATTSSLRTVMDLLAWQTPLTFLVDQGVVSVFAYMHKEDFICEVTGTARSAGFYTLAAGKAARPAAEVACTELAWEFRILDSSNVVQHAHGSWDEVTVHEGWSVEWACVSRGKWACKSLGSAEDVRAASGDHRAIRLDVPSLGFSRSVEVGGDSVTLKNLFQAAETSSLVWNENGGSLQQLGVMSHQTPVSTSLSSVAPRSTDNYGQRWECEVRDEVGKCVLRCPQPSDVLTVSVVLPATAYYVMCRCLSFSTRPVVALLRRDARPSEDPIYHCDLAPLQDPPFSLNDYRLLSSSVSSIEQVPRG